MTAARFCNRALHRVVHPGSRHQEQKQGQHIDTALHQQHRAGECHRRNAQLEHHARRGHEQRRFQLCRDGLLFHRPNFVGKTGQIPLLRIAGFQVPEGLDVLLNASAQAIFAAMVLACTLSCTR